MMIKRNLKQMILICFCVLFWSLPGYAINIEDVVNPRQTYGGWISDGVSILSDETEIRLNQEISKLKSSRGIELAIVTVPDLAPYYSSKSFATKLFNYWEIGDAKLNNGILLLIAVKEHRIEIEVGSGIAKYISAAQINLIIDSSIKPRFQKEKFDLGISDATERLIALLEDNVPEQVNSNYRYLKAFLILGACFLIGLANNLFERFQEKKRPPIDFDESLIQQAAKRKNMNFDDAGDSFYIDSSGSDVGGFSDFGGGSSDGGGDGGSW